QVGGQRLVEDDYRSIARKVVPGEVAAFHQAHSHRLQVAGRNDVNEHGNVIDGIQLLLTFGGDAPTPVPAHGQVVGYASRLDARNHQTSARDFMPDRRPLRRISPIVIVNIDGGGVAGLEARSRSRTRRKLRSSKPAPTSSTQARAISVITRVERIRSCFLLSLIP